MPTRSRTLSAAFGFLCFAQIGCRGAEVASIEPVEVVLAPPAAASSATETPVEAVVVNKPPEPPPSASSPFPFTDVQVTAPPPSFTTTAKPLGAVETAALKTVLAGLASKEAPNTKVDLEGAGTFLQGDIVTKSVTLQPGQCLVILAAATGVSELDLELYITLPVPNAPPPMMLAKDNRTGPVASIGAGGNCFKTPLPIPLPVEVVLRVSAGKGPAMFEVRH